MSRTYMFLDFDGVLNTLESYDYGIDPDKIKHILKILSIFPEMVIVVSSSWRDAGLAKCIEALDPVPAHKIIDTTPFVSCGPTAYLSAGRGEEIAKWMSDNNVFKEDVVIIDDIGWDMGALSDRLINIDGTTGITHKDVKAVCALFRKED